MTILHGENQVASRGQLALAKQGQRVLEFGSDVTLDRLVSAVGSDSLFGGANQLVLENLFSGRPSHERKAVINYLASHQDLDITIWEAKDVSAKIKEFNPQIVRRFDLPKYIFEFLDHPTVQSLRKCLETLPAEQVFASLVTRMHKRSRPDYLRGLLEIDYAQKTSAAPYDLATALELWVVKNVK